MKKLIFIVIVLLIAAASVGAGIFVAEKRAGKASEAAENSLAKEAASKAGDNSKTSVEIGGESDNNAVLVASETPENNEAKFSFAILGDTQSFEAGRNGNYQKAASNIQKLNPDLVFAVGDLVSSCDGGKECEAKLTDWKNILGLLLSKTYAAQGNHDRTGKEKADAVWQNVFSKFPANGPAGFSRLVYSFDFENSHFIVLASDKPKEHIINNVQRDWLEKDLSNNAKENTFVFFHEPAYPANSKIGESLDVNAGDRDALWNILKNHKVTAVFSGHEHIQSRRKVNGLYQFGFGNTESFDHLPPKPGITEYFHVGPAFGLVKIEGKKITVETYSVAGKLLNLFELAN